MRLKAMLDMGLKDIWVELIPKDKEKLAIEYALSANDRAGKYEADQLANLIGNFPDVEWGDFTVDTKDPELVSELMDKFSEVVEDEVPEVPKVAESKLGEVYELGRHRLMCGDSTDAGSVALLMNGHKADMVFTDPPYGMNLDADFDAMSKNSTKVKGNAYSNVIGDEVDFDPRPLMKLFDYCKEQLWWGADYYYDKLPPHGSWLIWAKRNENMLDIIGNHFEVCYSMNPRLRRIIYKNWSGVTARNPQFEREHPTEKPIALNADIIKERTTDNQLVVDLFGGSGSTLIACEQTNRICYMMELDPLYCDVIRNRYENFINRIKTAK
jgi:DNA modification methylase